LGEEQLLAMLKAKVPGADEDFLEQYVKVFVDLQRKAHDAEISSRAVDLRGIIAALKLTKRGAKPQEAMRWAVVNKVFDEYERQKVADIVHTRISRSWEWDHVFPQ